MKVHNPSRLTRDTDGSCRLRLRFSAEDADNIEAAAQAANMPVLRWIYSSLSAGKIIPNQTSHQ
jgi:hypothetical protein